MKRQREMSLIICLLMLAALLMPLTALANSAQPPAIIVLVPNAPDDLVITLRSSDAAPETPWYPTSRRQIAWESYYALYDIGYDLAQWPMVLRVEGGGQSFELPIERTSRYDQIITLDLAKQTCAEGKLLLRTAALIALRVALTLLLEGLIFFALGFRSKRSWWAFIGINLVTQVWLNIALSAYHAFSYAPIIALIGYELLIFIAEGIAFPLLVKERGVGRRIAHAFAANAVSLALGWWLIQSLPL